MALDLEEQEQLATLKAWWNQYGNLVTLAATAALLTVAAYQGWRYYRHSQAAGAVVLYEQLERAERGAEHKKVRDIAAQIVGRYGSTSYAVIAALASAKAAFTSGDLPAAKEQLRWVLDHAREDEVKDMARLRLAGVLLDEKKYAEALALLEAKPVDGMRGLYADLKGDILVAQGETAKARDAYQLALDLSESGSAYRATIQLKMDALGEAAPAGK